MRSVPGSCLPQLLEYTSLVISRNKDPERLQKKGKELSAVVKDYPLRVYMWRHCGLSASNKSAVVAAVGNHRDQEKMIKVIGLEDNNTRLPLRKFFSGPFALELLKISFYNYHYSNYLKTLIGMNKAGKNKGKAKKLYPRCSNDKDLRTLSHGRLPEHMLRYKARVYVVKYLLSNCFLFLHLKEEGGGVDRPFRRCDRPYFTLKEQRGRMHNFVYTFNEAYQ